MFDLESQDGDCLRAAERIARSKDAKPGDRTRAFRLLPRFQIFTAGESHKVFELVLECLEDPEPIVPMAASDALAGASNPSAARYIEAAMAEEQDESVRLAMRRDLKKFAGGRKRIDSLTRVKPGASGVRVVRTVVPRGPPYTRRKNASLPCRHRPARRQPANPGRAHAHRWIVRREAGRKLARAKSR